MKILLSMASFFIGLAVASVAHAETRADLIPPVVIKTLPEAGSDNAVPGETEVRIVFSKPMKNDCMTIKPINRRLTPEIVSTPHFEPDGVTLVLKVKLRPDTTYGLWVNGPSGGHFQDLNGNHALPYQFVFKTKAK